ncbi:MAG: sulfatase [Planctomycetes bacterium]|nr:sulfatase [Planctomycetota bacterium]
MLTPCDTTPALFARVAVIALALLTAAAGLRGQDAAAAGRRPNILLCVADDWGWPHAGALGDEVVATPTFDRLAREGVLFERAFVSSPSCTPSRNAILTGQQFYRLGEGANLHSTLDVAQPNFMMLLRDAGYRIGHWRKAWGPGDFRAAGYTEDPCGPASTFEAFLAGQDPAQPFCFWFGTSDPHRGYERGSGVRSGIDAARIRVPGFLPDCDDVRSDIADYYFEVQRWDRDVGGAVELLAERGLLDDTIVVMTGDNGIPFPRCKGNLYDWGTRVPLAIRWGGCFEPGRSSRAFVSFTDFAPTFLAAAGVALPGAMTGRSLLPLLDGSSDGADRDFVVCGRERHTPAQRIPSLAGYPARAIRTDRWLLIVNEAPERWPAGVPQGATHPMNVHPDCDDGPTKRFVVDHRDDPAVARFYRLCFARRPRFELYDCEADPDQLVNLAAGPDADRARGVLDELQRRLTDYLQATGDPRQLGDPAPFDGFPYRAGYLQKRLDAWREQHPEASPDPRFRAPSPGEILALDFGWRFGSDRYATREEFEKAVVAENERDRPDDVANARRQLALRLCDSRRCYVLYRGLDAAHAEYETKVLLIDTAQSGGITVGELLWQLGEASHADLAGADHSHPEVLLRHALEDVRESFRSQPGLPARIRDPALPIFELRCGS